MEGKREEGGREEMGIGGEGERGRGGEGERGKQLLLMILMLMIKKQSATIKVLDLTRLQVVASERKPCRIQYLATISEASKKHYTKQVNAATS